MLKNVLVKTNSNIEAIFCNNSIIWSSPSLLTSSEISRKLSEKWWRKRNHFDHYKNQSLLNRKFQNNNFFSFDPILTYFWNSSTNPTIIVDFMEMPTLFGSKSDYNFQCPFVCQTVRKQNLQTAWNQSFQSIFNVQKCSFSFFWFLIDVQDIECWKF